MVRAATGLCCADAGVAAYHSGPCGSAPTRHECALQEPAPLMVEILKQFLSMQLKLRARYDHRLRT